MTQFWKTFAGAAALIGLTMGGVPLALQAPAQAQTSASTAGSATAEVDPVTFFTGTTVSNGTIKEAFSSQKTTRATSVGTLQSDGSLVITQTVEIGDDPVRKRTWRLRELAGGKVTGSISDATSPVKGQINGNAMTLTYKLEGGLKVNQVLTMNPDGKTCKNEMKIRKFGIVVARLSEVISRK